MKIQLESFDGVPVATVDIVCESLQDPYLPKLVMREGKVYLYDGMEHELFEGSQIRPRQVPTYREQDVVNV